jgi:hypothetical protein
LGPAGAAAITSSSASVDHDDSVMMVAWLAAARAVASSPSGCAICCIAVGARQIGKSIFWPKTVVDMSVLLTSRKMRGRMRSRLKAALPTSTTVKMSKMMTR